MAIRITVVIFITIVSLNAFAQGAGGHIYQQHPFGHHQSHYWPDYIDGVNSLRPECFEYSSGGNNPTQPYEIRNSSISLNRARRQINTSSNLYGLTTRHQQIKFVETDIATQAFRRADFFYDSSSLCWWNTSIPTQTYNYLSGALMNARTGPHPLFPSSTITHMTGQGLIKQFELDANLNADIYTRYLGHPNGNDPINTTRYQDVIVKVIEVGDDIYACGYCARDNNFANATGIIYRIPRAYFNPPGINCTGAACPGVQLFTYGVFVSDIMEINGQIYFVGLGRIVPGTVNGIRGMIGNLTRNYVREDVNHICGNHALHGEPFIPSMNYNPNTNEIECLLIDHHAYYSGIAFYDLALSNPRVIQFDVDRMNLDNRNPDYDPLFASGTGVPPPAALLYKDLEYDQNFNFIISAYAFIGGRPHKTHFTLHRDSLYMSGAVYRPDVDFPPLGPLLTIAAKNVGPMQETIAFDPNDNSGRGFLYNTETYRWGVARGTQHTTLTNRLDYRHRFYEMDTSCITCSSMSIKIPIHNLCIENMREATLEPGDFDIETNPHVHDINIEEDYPMHCGGETEDGINGCPYWNRTIEFSNMTTNTNLTTELCQGDRMRLGAIQKNFFGTSTLRWFRDGVQIDQDRLTIVITIPGVYHFEATRNQHDGTTCTFVSNPLTITETRSEIVATPSDALCQGQGATLSVSGSTPSKYIWPAFDDCGGRVGVPCNTIPHNPGMFVWANIFVYNPTIPVMPTPYGYHVQVEYPNGCKYTLYKDIKRKGIYLNQTITETGGALETLSIEVCNWDLTPINNVQISTDLAPNNIVNAAPSTGGWGTVGNTNQFIIPTMPAATDMYTPACTTITMQVRVNKCASSLAIQGTYAGMTCPPIVSTQGYWGANNFTASITNTNLVSCNAVPMTLSGAPATGGYVYEWLRGTGTVPISTTNTCIANTTDRYHFRISRNQCTQTTFKDVIMNPAVTFTETVTPAVCNVQGKITVNATGGTPPYQYQARPQDPFTTSNILSVPFGGTTYNVVVKDSRGCTFSRSVTVGNANFTVNFSETITPQTCTNGGSITIVNPTTTGTCGAGTFTYLWSNGAITSSLSNINAGTYTVTVTDCNGCTKVKTLTVPNNTSVITAEIVPSLMNCASAQVRYMAYPSGGTAPYSYIWYRNGTQIAITPTLTTNDVNNLTVRITDANGNCMTRTVNNITTIHYLGSDYSKPKASTSGIPNILNNCRIYIKGSYDIDRNVGWNNCDVILESPINTANLTSIQVISPATPHTFSCLVPTNTHIHTCDNQMQKGISIFQSGSNLVYLTLNNSIIEDMYAAIHKGANGSLNINNSTLANNFIGIKVTGATSLSVSGGGLITATNPALKTILPAAYNNANLNFITDLEPGTSRTAASLSKGYAGIISSMAAGLTITASTMTPLQISNLTNGVLVKGGDYYLSDIKFSNVTDAANTYGTANTATLKTKNTIYAQGTTATNSILHYTNNSAGTTDIQNSTNGIIASDYNLQLQNIKMTNIAGIGVQNINSSTATPLTGYTKYNKILNSHITATRPVILSKYQTTDIQNNTFVDMGTSAITTPLVDISSVAGTSSTATHIPIANISNNTFTINKSRFGLQVTGLSAFAPITAPITSTNAQVTISNNKFTIFNTANTPTNGTHAAANLISLRNALIDGNTVSKGGTVPSYTYHAAAPQAAPYGIWASTVQNGTYSCNNFYTHTGSYFEGTNHGLLIKTNNYTSPKIGMLFANLYQNSTFIPTNSNKFYCGCCADYTMRNIGTTSVNLNNQANQNLVTACASGNPSNCAQPTPLPFIYNQSTKILGSFTGNNNTAVNTGDLSCQLMCYTPPSPEAPPQFKMSPSQEAGMEIVAKPSITIYPNPSTDRVKIELAGIEGDKQTWKVILTDIQGRTVYAQSHLVEFNSFEIIHGLPSGQYFVSISNGADLNFMERISVIVNN